MHDFEKVEIVGWETRVNCKFIEGGMKMISKNNATRSELYLDEAIYQAEIVLPVGKGEFVVEQLSENSFTVFEGDFVAMIKDKGGKRF